MFNLVFDELRPVVRVNPFLLQIALFTNSLYPYRVISEDSRKVIGCKIVSFFENIYRKDTTLAHL
ncbi:hypothetical protein PARMER_02608 [Parabacteroides merdae ATCC 43184]|nr:hypothetical protein PARMER_02608 [Parabacteroides merdae ATCC 43184]